MSRISPSEMDVMLIISSKASSGGNEAEMGVCINVDKAFFLLNGSLSEPSPIEDLSDSPSNGKLGIRNL